jgi:hypothetical protein
MRPIRLQGCLCPLNAASTMRALDKNYIHTRYPNGFDAGAPTDYYTERDAKASYLHASPGARQGARGTALNFGLSGFQNTYNLLSKIIYVLPTAEPQTMKKTLYAILTGMLTAASWSWSGESSKTTEEVFTQDAGIDSDTDPDNGALEFGSAQAACIPRFPGDSAQRPGFRRTSGPTRLSPRGEWNKFRRGTDVRRGIMSHSTW